MSSLRSRHNARYVDVVGLVHARVHGGCPMDDQPPWTDQHWVNGGEDLEVKLKDYLDGATVLFDAAGNVADGRLAGEGHGPHLARGHG